MKTLEKIANKCRKYVKCDTARISKPLDKMFLIIGFNRNTKDDDGIWINQNGNRIDFDYVQESVVASGKTEAELIESAKEYQRLCGMTWKQYFDELRKKQIEEQKPEKLREKSLELCKSVSMDEVNEILKDKPDKTAEEIISKIHTDKSNFEYCAKNNIINGTLLQEIRDAMQEYAKSRVREELIKFAPEICKMCARVGASNVNPEQIVDEYLNQTNK